MSDWIRIAALDASLRRTTVEVGPDGSSARRRRWSRYATQNGPRQVSVVDGHQRGVVEPGERQPVGDPIGDVGGPLTVGGHRYEEDLQAVLGAAEHVVGYLLSMSGQEVHDVHREQRLRALESLATSGVPEARELQRHGELIPKLRLLAELGDEETLELRSIAGASPTMLVSSAGRYQASPPSASSSSTPVLDIGQRSRAADHAAVSLDDLSRDLLGQPLTFDLVGTRGRWCAPGALDHVSNGLFACQTACSRLVRIPAPPERQRPFPVPRKRASELVLYLVAGAGFEPATFGL